MSPSRTTLLFVTAAAVVIVVGGIKAANHIVAPVMLSVALVIVVHPLRARFERHMPRWAASIIVLIMTVMLILSLAIAVAVSLGQLAKLIPTYATEMNGYVADVGEGLKNLGVGSDQSDSMVNSADVGKLVDLVTSILASVLDTLTSLFFIVTLLAFLAFDSAKTERLAEGARRHRPYLVDAMASFARGTRSYLGRVGRLRPDRGRDRHRPAVPPRCPGCLHLGGAGVRDQLHPQHRLHHRHHPPGHHRPPRGRTRA